MADIDDDQPIHYAAMMGDLQEVQRLVIEDPALIEQRGENDYTPLLSATEGAHAEIVLWLLNQGADSHAQDDYREDAL